MRKKWRAKSRKIVCEDDQANVIPSCEICGKPTHYRHGRAVRFCAKKPGAKRSDCNTRHSHKMAVERYRRDPAKAQARLLANQAYKKRRRQRDRLSLSDEQPSGSVLLTASPRAIGRDVLMEIYAAVPAKLPHDYRMEIICETALLIMEGAPLTEAVKQAGKNVRKNAAQLRNTKPIEDCFWLADESAWSPEALA